MPRGTKEASKKKIVRSKIKSNKKTKKEQIEKPIESTKDDKFSFDDEIVIALKRLDEPVQEKEKKKKNKKKNQERNKKKSNQKTANTKQGKKHNGKTQGNKNARTVVEEPEIIIQSKYMQNYQEEPLLKNKNNEKKKKKQTKRKGKPKQYKSPQEQEMNRRKRKRIFRVIKWLTLLAIIIGGIIFALLSPIFNIQSISVIGNEKISSETIISLSSLQNGQNIFQYRTSQIQENIKQNAYIDQVEIHRKLPDAIEIVVTEREATFTLPFGNAYVYINNQGYILEITSEKGDYPVITGYETPEEDIKAGNRLCAEDLEKLGDVLRIMEAAASIEENISELITEISIADKTNYILTLEKEKKQVYMGDTSNLSTKMLWIHQFLEDEKDHEGIIFINVDLNREGPYFREKV